MRPINYPGNVQWLCRSILFALILASGLDAAHPAQDPPPAAEEPEYEFFSGVVEELSNGRITVSRTALGKTETRTFTINAETKVEGQLRTKVRVTVRFKKADEGEVAVHIIVRG
jgi:hypothetical protein